MLGAQSIRDEAHLPLTAGYLQSLADVRILSEDSFAVLFFFLKQNPLSQETEDSYQKAELFDVLWKHR